MVAGPDVAFHRALDGRRLRTVAAAAGIDHSTLHHHFATKQDLIAAVVELATEPLRSTVADDGTSRERLDDPRARLVARWASASALVGASVLAVQFSLDGFGLPAVADRFAGRGSRDQAALGDVTAITTDAMVGLALLWVILLYGMTICLLAAADLLEPIGARWAPSPGWP